MKTLSIKKEHGGKTLHHLEVHVPKRASHGHLIMHHYTDGDGMNYHAPEPHSFGPDDGEAALAHIAKHAKIKAEPVQTEGIGKEEGGENELEDAG